MLRIFFYRDRGISGRVAVMREGEEEGDVLRRVDARSSLGVVVLDESEATAALEKMIKNPEVEEQLNRAFEEVIRGAVHQDRVRAYLKIVSVEAIFGGRLQAEVL